MRDIKKPGKERQRNNGELEKQRRMREREDYKEEKRKTERIKE